MSSGHKTVTAFVSTILALILAILGLLLGWPPWIWPFTAMGWITAAVTLARLISPNEDPLDQQFTSEPDIPVPPPERREQTVSDVCLPTCERDYDFRLTATVRWCPQESPTNAPPVSAAGLAINAVLERAEAITVLQPPHRASLTQHQLNGVLGMMLPDSTGRVLAMAEDVTLALAEPDASRLRKLATVRKDEELWEHERKYECNRREYLSQDVLKDTGSAVVWWLAKNGDQVEKTVDDLGVLAQLSSAVNDQDVPERLAHLVPYPAPDPDMGLAAASMAGCGTASDPFGGELCGSATRGSAFTYGAHGGWGNADGEHGGDGAPDSPCAPWQHFDALLKEEGLQPDEQEAAVLARYLADGAKVVGRPGLAADLRAHFDLHFYDASDDRTSTEKTVPTGPQGGGETTDGARPSDDISDDGDSSNGYDR